LDIYPITAYKGHFIFLVDNITIFLHEKHKMELKCHRYDVTDVEIFKVFHQTTKRRPMYINPTKGM